MVRLLQVGFLLFVVALPAAGQASRSAESASLAARLQKFEDKEEIQNLLLDYGRHLDNRDFAAYSRLFAKDGEWVGGFGTAVGRTRGHQGVHGEEHGHGAEHARRTITCSRTSSSPSTVTLPPPGRAGRSSSPASVARRSRRQAATTTRSCAKTATGDSRAALRPTTLQASGPGRTAQTR